MILVTKTSTSDQARQRVYVCIVYMTYVATSERVPVAGVGNLREISDASLALSSALDPCSFSA